MNIKKREEKAIRYIKDGLKKNIHEGGKGMGVITYDEHLTGGDRKEVRNIHIVNGGIGTISFSKMVASVVISSDIPAYVLFDVDANEVPELEEGMTGFYIPPNIPVHLPVSCKQISVWGAAFGTVTFLGLYPDDSKEIVFDAYANRTIDQVRGRTRSIEQKFREGEENG